MKAATCVRVVLPTDELVRVDCAKEMTVANLMAMLGRRCSPRKLSPVDVNDGRLQFSDDSNVDVGIEAKRSWPLKPAGCEPPHGELILVRMGKGLKAGSMVAEEVQQLDILEFRLVTPIFPSCTRETTCFRARDKVQNSIHSSLEGAEEIRPTSTSSIPSKHKDRQYYTAQVDSSRDAGLVGAAASAPPVSKQALQASLRGLLRRSRSGRISTWCRGSARRRYLSQTQGVNLLRETPRKRHHRATNRHDAERTMLRAGMQLIDSLQLLQGDIRGLVLLVRDAIMGNNALAAGDLLGFLGLMSDVLMQTSPCNRLPIVVPGGIETARQTQNTEKEVQIRKLSMEVGGSDNGFGVLQEGWVVSAEWGTFWRKQRKDFACLCENQTLYFFSSKTQCADYIFELGRERSGCASETSRRIMKDSAPVSQIDLSETDWAVRRKCSQLDTVDQQQRNAFAFFDTSGSMRLVLDVTTPTEAATWTRVITTEINRNRLFTKIHASNSVVPSTASERSTKEYPTPREWEQKMIHFAGFLEGQRVYELPLRSLYARIDRLDDKARAERHKSLTLSQALKDLQRDRIRINSMTHSGASLESIIIALTVGIWRTTAIGHERRSIVERLGESADNFLLPSSTAEMNALSFARQLILCSSRTHGGGDILDTLHLLFGTDKFCICPDAREMEPIEIVVSGSKDDSAALKAEITMKMTYRVIPKELVAPTGSHGTACSSHVGDYDSTTGSQVLMPTGTEGSAARQAGNECEQIEYKVVGTHTQRWVGRFLESMQVTGSVKLEFGD